MQKGGKIDEHIRLLSQGAYGCIFKPETTTKQNGNPEFITKIQKMQSTSDNETVIGKQIMKIKHYEDYFAPVLKSDKINIGMIEDDEVKKCDFLKKDSTNTSYESNQILYVGKLTLSDYLTEVAKNNPNLFIEIFISGHIILLEAIQRLIGAGIIHYDLRENNIMVRDSDGRPIIIDFGLSIDTTTEIKPSEEFYIYNNEYAPWCIDIVFISYIVNELGTEWRTKTATVPEMTRLVDEYINKNNGIKTILIPDERTSLKTRLIGFFTRYDNKPWQNIYDELLKYRNSWDNYSISVIYLFLFDNLNLSQYVGEFPFLEGYKQLLKTIIISSPDERISPKDTTVQINKLFGDIQRTIHKNLQKTLTATFKVSENIKAVEKKVAISKLAEQEMEQKIYIDR
jgi:serine/threonine protein kinase